MNTIKGFEPFQPIQDEQLEAGYEPTSGDTPGTNAVRQAMDDLEGLHARELLMAMPGMDPQTLDVYPHTEACEQRLLEAANLLRQAAEKLMEAKQST